MQEAHPTCCFPQLLTAAISPSKPPLTSEGAQFTASWVAVCPQVAPTPTADFARLALALVEAFMSAYRVIDANSSDKHIAIFSLSTGG